MQFVSLICGILTLVASWMIFKKMGHQGWEGILFTKHICCRNCFHICRRILKVSGIAH